MGSLSGMIKFLKNTGKDLKDIREKLDKIQGYFNDNYYHVNKVRNSELEFLQDEFLKDKKKFPAQISELFDEELKEQEKIFDKNLHELKQKKNKLKKEQGDADKLRVDLHDKMKKKNVKIDKREEGLKERVVDLEESIAIHNKTIDELNTGFGFVVNFFNMRKIQKEKDKIIDLRDSLVDEIEVVRGLWGEAEADYKEKINENKEEWNNINVEYSITLEKFDNLSTNRDELIKKAAFAKTLEKLKGDEDYLLKKIESKDHDKCPRCKSDNRRNKFFCKYCGERFDEDRKDVMGSLAEIGELNEVYNDLLTGIKECVSFLALMKGMTTGVDKFTESVDTVKGSQDQYSALPKLKIDIPSASNELSQEIEKMTDEVDIKLLNVHPHEFAKSLEYYTEKIFTDTNIEKFFTAMGDELNERTKEQW